MLETKLEYFPDMLIREPVERAPAVFPEAHEPHLAEDLELLRYRALAHAESFGYGVDSHLAAGVEQNQEPEARRVAENLEKIRDVYNFFLGQFLHALNIIEKTETVQSLLR